MSLVQKLTDAPIDIIGDVHGELEALKNLLIHLGYDEKGYHPNGRKLVFVGDLCDRGPNSPEVIRLVKTIVDNGNGQAILGNHELNLLQKNAKEGAGWYFSEREHKDHHYEPFQRANSEDKDWIYEFLLNLPLALENEQLRIVHATWDNEKINEIRKIPLGKVMPTYDDLEHEIDNSITSSGLLNRYKEEMKIWGEKMLDPQQEVPFLSAISEYNLAHQMNNPMRVTTSGVEQKCDKPFYASGKWRFVERYSWWDRYDDDKPVIVGHFWRKWEPEENPSDENVFENIEPTQWHGKHNNVFCVDYSVGARFKERNANQELGANTKLAALSWPEKTLTLETGEMILTTQFMENKSTSKPNFK